MLSFLRLILAFALAMALLPEWPAHASFAAAAAAQTADGSSYSSWILGLLCGVILTIAARVHWRDLPRRASEWIRHQSTRAGWASLGLCYAWILVFY